MHQSGHDRAHSRQTVQFSSRSALTPRARVGGDSLTCGYWTVLAPSLNVRNIVAIVTPRPLKRPGTLGMWLHRDLEDSRDDDVEQRQRDQHLPREALQLVLAEPRVAEAHP